MLIDPFSLLSERVLLLLLTQCGCHTFSVWGFLGLHLLCLFTLIATPNLLLHYWCFTFCVHVLPNVDVILPLHLLSLCCTLATSFVLMRLLFLCVCVWCYCPCIRLLVHLMCLCDTNVTCFCKLWMLHLMCLWFVSPFFTLWDAVVAVFALLQHCCCLTDAAAVA